jgi:hypothetical protein
MMTTERERMIARIRRNQPIEARTASIAGKVRRMYANVAIVDPTGSQVAKIGIVGRRRHLDALIAEHGGETRVVSVAGGAA